MDGQTDSACRGKEGAKYFQAERFQSLFLLQYPLIDGSNDTSLNTALIRGSERSITKASPCWVKTMKALLPALFNILVFLWFSSAFFFPVFCAFFSAWFFFCCSLSFCQCICFVVYLSLSEPFVCLLCTQKNPSLPYNSKGALRRKSRPINRVRGCKRGRETDEKNDRQKVWILDSYNNPTVQRDI